MSLQSGLYTITSVSHGDRLIGRSPIETLDLAPKQLFVLHEGASPPKVGSVARFNPQNPFTC